MSKHVQAKDLKHIKIKGTVHLWHCVNNEWKSLTNDPSLFAIEELAGFDIEKHIQLIAEEYGFVKNGRYEFKDGFSFIDHHTKTGNYIIADGWTKEVENVLKERGYLISLK